MSTRKPNILITGSPGAGKTTISKKVAKKLQLRHIDVSKFAIQRKLIVERDEERDCGVLDDHRVWKKLQRKLIQGGYLIEYHSCGFMKKDLFDAVFVLRAQTSELHKRLTERGYKDSKITENIECEIFQVALEEATETFGSELVTELENNDETQILKNTRTIAQKVKSLLNKAKRPTD